MDARYPAQAFHKDFPSGKSSGDIVVTSGSVTFTGGGRSVTLPFSGLKMSVGGASNRLVFFAHAGYPDWSIYSSERAILRNPNIVAHPELTGQAGSARRQHTAAWALLAAVVLLVVAIPAVLLFQMDWITRQLAQHVPVSWEENLGKSAMAQYGLQTQLMDDAEAQRLLAPLLAPLSAQLLGDRHRYRFHIANDPQINAFALPGGDVVINSGLLLKAEHGSEVLGVLAHEITHVREQHGVRAVMGGTGIFIVVQALVGDASGLLAAVAGAAPMFINQSYSRGFEREADKYGVVLLARAGIDPNGMVLFFEKLRAEEKKQLKKVVDDAQTRDAIEAGMRVLGSHPATEERMAYLREQIALLPAQAWRDTDHAMPELQAAVAAFATREAEEQPSQAELPPTARTGDSADAAKPATPAESRKQQTE